MAQEAEDTFDDDECKIERRREREHGAQAMIGEVVLTMMIMVMMLVIVTA